MNEQPVSINLNVQWPQNHFEVPQPVNQIAVQSASPDRNGSVEPDQFQLMFGFLQLPLIQGEPTPEYAAELSEQTFPVATVGKFVFTRDRLVELHHIIGSVIDGGGIDVRD